MPLQADNWSQIYRGDEPVRINKWLAQNEVCSRREAETLIRAGAVSIDGERVDDLGRKVSDGQTVSVDRSEYATAPPFTIVMHKPTGYVSSQPEDGQIPAIRLVATETRLDSGDAFDFRQSFAPLGRLDQDSRGLLLLSTDGVLAKALVGPESQLEKEYIVKVRGRINRKVLRFLRHGMVLDNRKLKHAIVEDLGRQTLRFILTEGRKRQIRRMCEVVDLRVVDLKRIRIGPLKLDGIDEGRWRQLTGSERMALIAASKEAPKALHTPQSPRSKAAR